MGFFRHAAICFNGCWRPHIGNSRAQQFYEVTWFGNLPIWKKRAIIFCYWETTSWHLFTQNKHNFYINWNKVFNHSCLLVKNFVLNISKYTCLEFWCNPYSIWLNDYLIRCIQERTTLFFLKKITSLFSYFIRSFFFVFRTPGRGKCLLSQRPLLVTRHQIMVT